ncbi:thioredoxin domain-containing protein [Vibrio sp. JC009]|uniref:thioredoxin domain-containing protein n=1 Tax=Vibrio sp. JC009 TaxID=2912314 RepID=UPI0023B0C96C|nr:thioredoxin domain-containing protein [Vibrio sp. JC009]WED24466.1 thioredoxin domain-containing protein [Vibrio sp. JC009]
MLKVIFKSLIVILAVFSTVACSDSSNAPSEGKQYSVLPKDLSHLNLSPVTEIFSLTCGHCRNMEHMLPEIEKLTNQEVGKVHVTFNQSAQVTALFYYAAVMQLNKTPDAQMMDELFSAIQMQDSTMTDQKAAVENAFISRDLKSPYKMDQTELDALSQLISTADTVTQDGEINAVPTFIIKGKYQIITEGHQSLEEMAATINYLLNQK